MHETVEWQKADGSGAVVLAGEGDVIKTFDLDGEAQVQIAKATGALAAKPIGRGNSLVRLTLSVQYAPETSAAAARQAAATKMAALRGALLDHALLEGVFSGLTWQIADARVERFRVVAQQVGVFGTFSFVGSNYTLSETP